MWWGEVRGERAGAQAALSHNQAPAPCSPHSLVARAPAPLPHSPCPLTPKPQSPEPPPLKPPPTQDLAKITELVAPSDLGPRAYFLLMRYFESKGLVAEALHCYHAAQAANLQLSPAMDAAAARLQSRPSPGGRGRG